MKLTKVESRFAEKKLKNAFTELLVQEGYFASSNVGISPLLPLLFTR